jgi:FkbM family methyltransferase
MHSGELLQRFNARLRYKQARPWLKPLLDPGRFTANQLRRFGLLRSPAGTVRKTQAFHQTDFTVVSHDPVSAEIVAYGIYEAELTAAFLRLVKPGQAVVDIGMHLGYFTALFAQLVGTTGQVHAFEPTPSTRELAEANVSRFPQVTVHPFAAWSSRTTITFQDYGAQWMAYNSFTKARFDAIGEGKPFQAQTETLDNFRDTLGCPIALLKIDAESAEQEILFGSEKLLKTDHPVVSLEVGDSGTEPSSRRLLEWMLARQYAVWETTVNGFTPHRLRDRYVYDNLIFAPAGMDLSQSS